MEEKNGQAVLTSQIENQRMNSDKKGTILPWLATTSAGGFLFWVLAHAIGMSATVHGLSVADLVGATAFVLLVCCLHEVST